MRTLVGKAAVLATAAVIGLAACGGGDGGSSDTKEGWQDEHGELFEAYSRDLSAAGNTINQGERTLTINTAAVGGNASLLAGS